MRHGTVEELAWVGLVARIAIEKGLRDLYMGCGVRARKLKLLSDVLGFSKADWCASCLVFTKSLAPIQPFAASI